MYRQYDGYPAGHGKELAEFINKRTILNGFGSQTMANYANGIECLAAQIVKHFKDSIGGIYLYPTSEKDCGQDYVYHVYTDKVKIVDYNNKKTIFNGTWKDFLKFCENDR